MSGRFRRLTALGTSALAALPLIFGVSAIDTGVAEAATLPTFAAVLDDAHDQVFVSSGPDRSSVRVLALDGGSTAVLDGLWGASGLALAPDGSRLYVGLTTADSIAVIDTATLTEITRVATGVGSCPVRVAAGVSQLWFLDGCVDGAASGTLELRAVDLGTSGPSVSSGGPLLSWDSSIMSLPDNRVLARNSTANGAVVYDGTTLAVVASVLGSERLVDVAVDRTPGSLYVTGTEPGIRVLSLTDYTVVRTLGTGTGGRLSVSPDGTHVAVYAGSTLGVHATSGELRRTIDHLYNMPITLLRNSDLVLGDYDDVLRIISRATTHVASLAWQAPPAVKVDQPFTLHAQLSSDRPIPAGTTVHLSRTTGSATTALPDTVTDDTGQLTVSDIRPLPGSYLYRASYDGDADHDRSSAALSVRVQPLTPVVTVTLAANKVPYRGTTTLTLRIPSDLTNRRVLLLQRGSVVRDVTLDAAGKLSYLTSPMVEKTTLEVRTGADARYAASSTMRYVLVGHSITETLVDGYKTVGTDGYYHAGAPARMSLRVPDFSPLTGDVEIQVLSGGLWKPYATRRNLFLGHTPKLLAYFGPTARGTIARMRVTVHATAQHLQATGPWRVLRYTT